MPSISVSSMVQNGHPYVVVDFGAGGSYKTAIALDEESEDGDKVGDKLAVGDVLTVILTSKSKAVKVSKEGIFERAFKRGFSVQFPVHRGHCGKLFAVQNVQAAESRVKTG